MTKRQAIVMSLLWLGLVGFAGFKARLVAQLRAQREELQVKQRRLDAEAAAWRQKQAALTADLAQAEQQLAALPATRGAAPGLNVEQRAEIDRWLGRVRQLRQYFADHFDRRIPEMQFLKDEDWLRVAKTQLLENDEDLRIAAAALRTRAITLFTEQISAALRKYLATSKQRPESAQALVAYFDPPIDPMLLERYAIADKPTNVRGQSQMSWSVMNKAPIDPDYDTRYQIIADGWSSNSGVEAWDQALADRYREASAKFRKANPGGNAKGVDDVLSYFDPPLEKERAEQLRKIERVRRKQLGY